MSGEIGVQKRLSLVTTLDFLGQLKPEISDVSKYRTEKTCLALCQNLGKPQNDRDYVPSSGCTGCVGQPLMTLVRMWDTQYFGVLGRLL